MANPYYVTFQFPEHTLGTGDKIRVNIIFTVNDEESDQTIIAQDNFTFISDYGSLEWAYDLENLLLVPGFYDIKIAATKNPSTNADNEFEKYFFGEGAPYNKADKRAEVLIEMKYLNTKSWIEEFRGNILPQPITSEIDRSYISFTAAPETDKLNKRMLFGLDDNYLNPLGYGVPFSCDTLFKHVKDIILDCYKIFNPNLTANDLEIWTNWIFGGHYYLDPPGTHYFVTDGTFEELTIATYYLFFHQYLGLRSIGDVLRKLAIDFGCFTGVISKNKVFFRKLFAYNPADVYDLSNDSYWDFEKHYSLNLLSYVHVKMDWPCASFSRTYHAPNIEAFTELEDTYLDRTSMIVALANSSGWTSASNVYIERTGAWGGGLYMIAVKDPNIVYTAGDPGWGVFQGDYSFVPSGRLLADFWYNFRSDVTKCRIDPIIAPGLNHSIIKNPRLFGKIYQPLRIKKLYQKGRTEIDGIIVG